MPSWKPRYDRLRGRSSGPAMDAAFLRKLQHASELLAEAQTVLNSAFALQGAASASVYKTTDEAWQSIDKVRAKIDKTAGTV